MRVSWLPLLALATSCSASHGVDDAGTPPVTLDGETHFIPHLEAGPLDASDGPDVFFPGTCVWSRGLARPITHDVSGGKLLGAVHAGAHEVVLAWSSAVTNDLYVESLDADGTVTLDAQRVAPTPAAPGLGSLVVTSALRGVLFAATGGCELASLSEANVVTATPVPIWSGRCLEAEATSDHSLSIVALSADGSAGASYEDFDLSSRSPLVQRLVAPSAVEAHRTVRVGGSPGHFLFVARDSSGQVTTQHFDPQGAPVAEPVVLAPEVGTLRGVGPLEVDEGWLLTTQVQDESGFHLATVTLDLDGRPTREPFVVQTVQSVRGLYYDVARSGDDVIIAWTEWLATDAPRIAIHTQAFSQDGFPRGAVVDLYEGAAIEDAPDDLALAATARGVVVIFHARMDPFASPELYAALLRCVPPT